MTKKRILFILHLPPPVHGSSFVGSQIHDSKTINNQFDTKYINLSTSDFLAEIGEFSLSKLCKYFSIIIRLLKELINQKPDLVYIGITAKGIAFYKDAILIFFCKLFGIPVIYHFHNKGVKSAEKKCLKKLIYNKVFGNGKAIILSKILYKDICNFFPIKNVFECPNGLLDNAGDNIVEFRMNAAKNKSRHTILFLSNLIRTKGCLILLEACNKLHLKGIDFRCLLVGDEGDINKLELNLEIERLNLQEKVFYLGKKLGKEKEDIFLESDLFALPTFYPLEALPLVNIEAMHWGLPVVSTFEGGIPDQVVDNESGFLVPQGDVVALTEKLEILLTQPDLRLKMSIASRMRYEQCYTFSAFEQRMKSILSSVVGIEII